MVYINSKLYHTITNSGMLDLLHIQSCAQYDIIMIYLIICTLAENRITYLQKAPRDGAKGTI